MSKLNNSNRDRHLVGFVPPLGHDVDAGGVVRGEGDCLEMALVLLITSSITYQHSPWPAPSPPRWTAAECRTGGSCSGRRI